LWFASGLRKYHNGYRKASILLLALHVSVAAIILTKLLFDLQNPPKLLVFGNAIHVGPVAVAIFAVTFAIIFLIPMIWLLTPGTRAAFNRQLEAGHCVNCGYDLRATPNRCPECGKIVVPSRPI
jgi:hypothetical protein